jgi:hypothetical protein
LIGYRGNASRHQSLRASINEAGARSGSNPQLVLCFKCKVMILWEWVSFSLLLHSIATRSCSFWKCSHVCQKGLKNKLFVSAQVFKCIITSACSSFQYNTPKHWRFKQPNSVSSLEYSGPIHHPPCPTWPITIFISYIRGQINGCCCCYYKF